MTREHVVKQSKTLQLNHACLRPLQTGDVAPVNREGCHEIEAVSNPSTLERIDSVVEKVSDVEPCTEDSKHSSAEANTPACAANGRAPTSLECEIASDEQPQSEVSTREVMPTGSESPQIARDGPTLGNLGDISQDEHKKSHESDGRTTESNLDTTTIPESATEELKAFAGTIDPTVNSEKTQENVMPCERGSMLRADTKAAGDTNRQIPGEWPEEPRGRTRSLSPPKQTGLLSTNWLVEKQRRASSTNLCPELRDLTVQE